MLKNKPHIIIPNWQVPVHVKAFTTTCIDASGASRESGVCSEKYGANNLALHVGDDVAKVLSNRKRLEDEFNLPSEPLWLNQTHTTKVVNVADVNRGVIIDADASYTKNVNEVSVVMTADCLPVLISNKAGTQVAAIHAGWRGLLNGIIENTIEQFSSHHNECVAWLGPAIGPDAFEVGGDVRDFFIEENADAAHAFQPINAVLNEKKWLANIYALARLRLKAQGVNEIYGGDFCTYQDEARFYSYRRDGVCGRMATLIWIDESLTSPKS